MFKSAFFGAFITAAGLLLSADSASADPAHIYGIHWYGDPNSNDVESMSGGKALWDLETVMLYDGGWSMSAQAAKLQAVANKGHTVIIRVQPRWGQAIPMTSGERSQYLIDIENAARQAAGFCHIWQIGNEMNLADEYGGQQLQPSDYANYYKQVRTAIKKVTSPLGPQIVCVGPVSPGSPFGEIRWMDGNQYLSEMCNSLTSADCDAFALHGYGAPWLGPDAAVADFRANYSGQLTVIDNKGFANKPAYILEFNRQTNPPTDATQEAWSAQFLIKAYQDLQSWNSNPANHKVACATWFIYPHDSGTWAPFSILYLRGLNPRGVNQDLWDSFQYACSLNIPSGGSGPNAAVVVDNPAASYVGTWTLASGAADKYGADYRYKTGSTAGNYAEFRPNLPAGSTNVYAWWSQGGNRTPTAPYMITHAAGTTQINANQQANGGKWNLLGTFNFNAGTGGYVRLTDAFSSSQVGIADAVKFVTITPAETIVDNAQAGFTASANWSTGTSAADKYGANYRFRATQPVGDAATWNFSVPQNRNYEIYAWWSQGSNRSATAPYVVSHARGTTSVIKNQQTGGGTWQTLGTHYFLNGANNVKLSCWTTTGYVVMADAIRVVAR